MSILRQKIGAIKKNSSTLEKEIREKTLGYIVASFSLVAGLAWNEAIKAAIEAFFPMSKDTVKAKLIYAVVITIVVVIISVYVVSIFKKEGEEETAKNKKSQQKKKTDKK